MTPEEIKAQRAAQIAANTTLTRGAIAVKLADLRRQFDPDDWPGGQSDSVLLLSDVCQALELSPEEKLHVLGIAGITYEDQVLGNRYYLLPRDAAKVANAKTTGEPPQPDANGIIRERVTMRSGSIEFDDLLAQIAGRPLIKA